MHDKGGFELVQWFRLSLIGCKGGRVAKYAKYSKQGPGLPGIIVQSGIKHSS